MNNNRQRRPWQSSRVMIKPALMQKIEAYQKANELKSNQAAVDSLLELALRVCKKHGTHCWICHASDELRKRDAPGCDK